MDIQLNLINQSQDVNNSSYVIFQQNVAENFGELAIAWVTVDNLGIGDNHPFAYPMQFQVGAGDAWGNFTPRFNATNGQVFAMVRTNSGDQLQATGDPASSPTEVEIRNSLPEGGISANIYRNGLLLAQKTNVSPSQKAVFEFKPQIFIGAVSQIQQGQVMNSAILQGINTELDLLGLTSADIVITGGGGGPDATPFVFTLTNEV
jgi:hypothetical protein